MSAGIDATSAARLRALLAELEAFLSDLAAVVLGCGAIAGDPATLDGVDRAYYDDLVRLAAACAAAEAAFAAGEDGAAIDHGLHSTDASRLDWLDEVNARTNAEYGTKYGWKFDINHNRAALTDHNLPALTVREAIDEAIRRSVRSKEAAP